MQKTYIVVEARTLSSHNTNTSDDISTSITKTCAFSNCSAAIAYLNELILNATLYIARNGYGITHFPDYARPDNDFKVQEKQFIDNKNRFRPVDAYSNGLTMYSSSVSSDYRTMVYSWDIQEVEVKE